MVRICSDGSELHTVIRVAARERRPNGAMAQLVARFHGMEEVGGSNPPSSTKNSDTQLVSVGFLLSLGGSFVGLKDKKSWSEPDLSALRCEKVWFKVVGGQL